MNMQEVHAGDEAARLASLQATGLLDTLPEAAYDAIVQLARILCAVPIALVSLVDQDRQWFKARVGLDAQQTPRNVSFCDHAIRTPHEIMEVEDAARDPRFADNPLVLGEPGIRFYAGCPIVTSDGLAMGTVCVIGHQPRRLTPDELVGLSSLAELAAALMDARRQLGAAALSGGSNQSQ